MFESISWTDFVLTLAISATVYYAVIILLYFSGDVKKLLKRQSDHTTGYVGTKKLVEENHNLMGAAQAISPVSEVAVSHIEESTQVVATSADLDTGRTWRTNEFVTQPLHRSFSQLLEEINALAYIIAQNSKEEISLLFETLLSRYPQLAKPHHQSSINQFIIEACQQHGEMTLSHQDIDQWWTQALGNSTSKPKNITNEDN